MTWLHLLIKTANHKTSHLQWTEAGEKNEFIMSSLSLILEPKWPSFSFKLEFNSLKLKIEINYLKPYETTLTRIKPVYTRIWADFNGGNSEPD